jgi:mono/diheme cytochrome c family protein
LKGLRLEWFALGCPILGQFVLGSSALGRFVSGHRFSDAATIRKSTAPLGAGLAAILLALLFSSSALADSGSDTYKAKCAACHGAKGQGDTMLGRNLKVPALGSPEVQTRSDDELIAIISRGKKRMPPFDRKLSKDEIRDVLKFVRSLKK